MREALPSFRPQTSAQHGLLIPELVLFPSVVPFGPPLPAWLRKPGGRISLPRASRMARGGLTKGLRKLHKTWAPVRMILNQRWGASTKPSASAATYVLPIGYLWNIALDVSLLFCGGPSRTRTCDPLIMSPPESESQKNSTKLKVPTRQQIRRMILPPSDTEYRVLLPPKG